VQQRLVVARLELVGADQQPVRIFLDVVGDSVAGEAVQGCLGDLRAAVLVFARESHDGLVGALDLRQVVTDRVVVLDRPLDAAGDHHGPGLAADLLQADHLLLEMVDHDLGLQPDRVLVALDVPPQLLLGPFVSNSGSLSMALTSL
jgi:hypothetical protein